MYESGPPPWQQPPPRQPPRRSRAWIGWLVCACAVVLVLCGGGAVFAAHLYRDRSAPTPSTSASGSPGSSARADRCVYGDDFAPAAREVRLPKSGAPVPTRATLVTSRGTIRIDLVGARASCTLRSFASLAAQGFYDDSPCHRVVTTGVYLLQCGDPSGTGTRGSGYTVPDENLPTGKPHPYPKGTVGWANVGRPNSGGSQFFICNKENILPADYAVVGTVTAGLSIVDTIAAGGTDGANGPGDGKPKLPITLTSVTVR